MRSVHPADFDAVVATIKDHDLDPTEVTITQVRSWHHTAEAQRHGSFARGFVIGRALAAQKKAIKYGQTEAWAAKVGISSQMVRTYLRGFAAIEKARSSETGFTIPVGCSFTGWVRTGCPGDGIDPNSNRPKVRTPAQLAAAANRSVNTALAKVIALPKSERRAVLSRIVAEVDQALGDVTNHTATEDGPAQISLVADSAYKLKKGQVAGLFPYMGGKRASVKDIAGEVGDLVGGRVYCEPSVGAGSVALNLLARGLVEKIRINDIDKGVVAYWNAVLHEHEELQRRVLSWAALEGNVKEAWASRVSGRIEGVDLAFAELVIRRTSHCGAGLMTGAPPNKVGWDKWNPQYIVKLIDQQHALLKGRVVGDRCTNMDMLDVIAEPGNRFLMVDPPYCDTAESSYVHPFGEQRHRALAAALHQTAHDWFLCYDDAKLVYALYTDFEIELVEVAHTSKSRKGETGKLGRAEVRIRSYRRLMAMREAA